MGSFTDFVDLRVVCCNRNRSIASAVEEEVKSVVVKFGTIIVNTSYQTWIATEPRVFEGINCFLSIFLWYGTNFNKVSNQSDNRHGNKFNVNSTRFIIPTPNSVPMNFLPGR